MSHNAAPSVPMTCPHGSATAHYSPGMDPDTELRDDSGGEGQLPTVIKREFRNRTPAKQNAEGGQQTFGRDRVLDYLLAVKLPASARKALTAAGPGRAAHVSLSGLETPQEARIHLSVEHAETLGLDDLPVRAREALAPFLTTLAFPVGGHGAVDERLLNTGPVRLTKARPRT